MDYRVISIGTLAFNPLWDEGTPVRTGHATTTLIRSDDAVIVVDPGLPPQVLAARLSERAGIAPSQVTHVFLSSFKADTCRGITLFEDAQWLVNEAEREGAGVPLAMMLQKVSQDDDPQAERIIEELQHQVAVLQRCSPAPDQIAPHVDLFPLPGVTPGLCGLLLPTPTTTVLIAGDAVPTVEYLEQGSVPPQATDIEKARESFAEAIEVADIIVPGRDNVVVNPTKRPF